MEQFDVLVIGAGHAGIEAALASARLGRRTACVTLRLDRIGHLPCNCSIGGPAKGHMAREVDALGGQMGVTTDHTVTHIRRVGTGRGPAVQTVRAQVCKNLYPAFMGEVMGRQPNLTLIQNTVETLVPAPGGLIAVLADGTRIEARAVVITAGTFLNGLCHMGANQTVAARHGDQAVAGLSRFLTDLGVNLRRFKTGTTPRVRLTSLQLERCEELPSEPEAGALSYKHDRLYNERPLLSCWQTWTNADTHETIRQNLGQSAMYSGAIQGVGPRYCPSIEDKVVRFSEVERHPIFLEIETWDGGDVYVQGVSTSLPEDVQRAILHTVPGLENAEIIRPGYAVEYDMADPLDLTPQLMSKFLPGLFLAGQINGTSGYEEAAGQGIVAGMNAARFACDEAPIFFPRQNSFLGVMIDDLVTKGVEDPYRMLTARAEHRLTLRSDNADTRLTPIAREVGLCDDDRWARFAAKHDAIAQGRHSLEEAYVHTGHAAEFLALGELPLDRKTNLFELLRRPKLTLEQCERIAEACNLELSLPQAQDARDQIELAAKYSGYLGRQEKLAVDAEKLEAIRIPDTFDFENLVGLSHEGREKLMKVRPESVGQASRVPGVRMSDVALLMGNLKRFKPSNEPEPARAGAS
jgi:tRNA uridine 5-carboxymethylaminomethyl modification enzyme